MQSAVNGAIHNGYVAAEIMRLCASGLEQEEDGNKAISAFLMIADSVERHARALDDANTMEPSK